VISRSAKEVDHIAASLLGNKRSGGKRHGKLVHETRGEAFNANRRTKRRKTAVVGCHRPGKMQDDPQQASMGENAEEARGEQQLKTCCAS